MTDFNNPYPIKRSIRISDKELATPQQITQFVALVGEKQFERVFHQFAEQRVPPEKPGGFTPEQIGQMSPKMYEDNRPAIQADLNAVAGPDEEVHAEFEISDLQLSTAGAKLSFEKLFGYDRMMEALGLEDKKTLTTSAYRKALGRDPKPYNHRAKPGGSNAKGGLDKPNPNVAQHSKSDHEWIEKSGSDKPSSDKGDKPE